MRRMLIVVSSLYLGFAVVASSQVLDPRFALHAVPHSDNPDSTCVKSPIYPDQGPTPCSEFVTNAEIGTDVDVYLVIVTDDSSGISAARFGVAYDCEPGVGVDVLGWTECISGYSFPSTSPPWPEPGSGTTVVWDSDDCQNTFVGDDGIHALVGVFRLFAYDGSSAFLITPYYASEANPLAISDCQGQVTNVHPDFYGCYVGILLFGSSQPGWNPCVNNLHCEGWGRPEPCDGTPVLPSTWGRIKTLYGQGQSN
jgi:hypothetical protein